MSHCSAFSYSPSPFFLSGGEDAALSIHCHASSCRVRAPEWAGCGLPSHGVGLVALGLVGSQFLDQDQTHVPCIGKWILNHWSTREIPQVSFFSLFSGKRTLSLKGILIKSGTWTSCPTLINSWINPDRGSQGNLPAHTWILPCRA